jgi:predicted CoA-binding protein
VTAKATVDDFLAQRTLALVGASRDPQAFSNTAFKELKAKGYRVIPVNPHTDTVLGERCYPSLRDLPEPVGGALIMVPPAQAEAVVRDAAAAGIPRVWMQQGAASETAVKFCQEHGIREVHGECILMFAQPQGFGHKAHRWVWGVLGKLPK